MTNLSLAGRPQPRGNHIQLEIGLHEVATGSIGQEWPSEIGSVGVKPELGTAKQPRGTTIIQCARWSQRWKDV